MNLLHCDNVKCRNTTPVDMPHTGWLTLKLLNGIVALGEYAGEWHFCSMACTCIFAQENM